MKTTTREHILSCGSKIIHLKGYSATGIKEILDAAEVPKGSFYFYFKSKEDFCLALVAHYREMIFKGMEEAFGEKEVPPLERLHNFFVRVHEIHEATGYKRGCPIGNLSQEIGATHPTVGKDLEAVLGGMASRIAAVLEEAEERGELPPRLKPDETAAFILSAWQGAFVQMKALAGPAPLENFMSMVFDVLLV
ncbi:TetR/AcrR family transcriptional regulator [Desulfococcaceae bacterium OttesenSCG-928-F15]|nr:TetR/AcrR family transcriptional regulator [Desulfococcaceae bacterium OttesenSCG-928-F15]